MGGFSPHCMYGAGIMAEIKTMAFQQSLLCNSLCPSYVQVSSSGSSEMNAATLQKLVECRSLLIGFFCSGNAMSTTCRGCDADAQAHQISLFGSQRFEKGDYDRNSLKGLSLFGL